MSRPRFRFVEDADGWRWECARCSGYSRKFQTEQEARDSARTDHTVCRAEAEDHAAEPEVDQSRDTDDEGHPEPPSEDEVNSALPVRPDPRQPAYDAVYEYIRGLGNYLPPDPVHRNAVIWRAVHEALGATPVGRCVSSHCVEGGHILDLGETP